MPTSRLVERAARHYHVVGDQRDRDPARLAVLIAILVGRSMAGYQGGVREASNIGQPIPTVGVPATITSEK